MQARSDDITTIFDDCLERLRFGESIEACLLDYPSEAEELEPLLIAATYARSTLQPPSLSPQARQAIQRQLHQAVAARQPAQRRKPAVRFAPFAMRFALALLIALLSLGSGVAAAQSSLPGSLLYPLKRASESARLRLASSATQRAWLHLNFAKARSAEILALASDEQKALSGGLVEDLDQEYQLAWQEIGKAPADQVPDLVGRYVVEREADVKVFSIALIHANAAARVQIQRAVRLGEQALTVVDPARRAAPQATPDHGANINGTPTHGAPHLGDMPATTGPKTTPEGKPDTAGPKPTPEGKPDTAGPKPTPEGKPDTAGPKATPEGKPDTVAPKPTDVRPQPTPKDKPANAEPKATLEGKPADAGAPATPEGKPADVGPNPTTETKPADAGPPATPEGKPEDKPDNGGSNPKPKPKPGHGKP